MRRAVHCGQRIAAAPLALLALSIACSLCQAQSQGTLQLELPSLDGSAFIRLDHFVGKPLVLNFWSSDCPPCIAEMPVLFQEALQYPQAQFLGIAIEDRRRAAKFLERHKVTYPQVFALPETDGIMRRFGNPKGVLPYTVVLTKNHQICQMKSGMIDATWLQSALANCSP